MRIIEDIITLGKCLIMSGKPSAKGSRKDKSIVVMGNGPSLRATIDNQADVLHRHDLLAVNFAANTPDFFSLSPQMYVLADPHFFAGASTDENVTRLWENLRRVSWDMTLWIPTRQRRNLPQNLPDNITVKYFNLTPGDGASPFLHRLYDAGLAMPRPRNVLIPAIMVALREGYREIWLAGADHTWTRTLSVDEDNRVVSIQPHFYKDSGKELNRVATEYKNLHLHDVLGSMTIAFRSYFNVRNYAEKIGARIINATPGSFIDAFERSELQ